MDGEIEGQLVFDTELMDTIFQTCDIEKKGCVLVSTIEIYLKKITKTNPHHNEAVEMLCSCLDPMACDPFINLVTFRRGVHLWIQYIDRHENAVRQWDVRHAHFPSVSETSICSDNGIVVGTAENCDSVFRQAGEVTATMTNLCHVNDCLRLEIGQLRAQLEIQEESVAVLVQDKQRLGQLVSSLQEDRKASEYRIVQLEDDLVHATNSAVDLESTVCSAMADKSRSCLLVKQLQVTLDEHKEQLLDAERLHHKQHMELSEKEKKIFLMEAENRELSSINQVLKKNNDDVRANYIFNAAEHGDRDDFPSHKCVPHIASSTQHVDTNCYDGGVVVEDRDNNNDNSSRGNDPDCWLSQLPKLVNSPASIYMELRDTLLLADRHLSLSAGCGIDVHGVWENCVLPSVSGHLLEKTFIQQNISSHPQQVKNEELSVSEWSQVRSLDPVSTATAVRHDEPWDRPDYMVVRQVASINHPDCTTTVDCMSLLSPPPLLSCQTTLVRSAFVDFRARAVTTPTRKALFTSLHCLRPHHYRHMAANAMEAMCTVAATCFLLAVLLVVFIIFGGFIHTGVQLRHHGRPVQ